MKNYQLRERQLKKFKARAVNRNAPGADFLHLEAAEIIGQRLAAVERKFCNPAIFFNGIFADTIIETVKRECPAITAEFVKVEQPFGDTPLVDLEPESIDLAISVFDLQHVQDLPSMLFQINMALKPDGLLMAVIPCEGTLKELKDVLLRAELEHSAGAANRINLFAPIRELGDLLQKTGFKLPVVDLEERTIRYSKLKTLIEDLRNVGAGNLQASNLPGITRKVIQETERLYFERYSDRDQKIRVAASLAFLSGWREDASQQKPLKPGSAKARLSDALKY